MESINLTNTLAGLAAIQRAMAGEDILFTKLEIGDGVLINTDVSGLTGLINKTREYPLGAVQAEDSEVVRLRSNISNKDVNVDLVIREYGIYAKFGNEQEFLFAYLNVGNLTTPLPNERIGRYELNRDFILYIGNSQKVDFTSNGHLIYVDQKKYKTDMDKKGNVEETLETLKLSSRYKENEIVEILGKTITGDGDSHKRIIKIFDDGTGVRLKNGLYANIVKNSFGIDLNEMENVKSEIQLSRTEKVSSNRIQDNEIPSSKLKISNNEDKIKLINLSDEVIAAMGGNSPIRPEVGANEIVTEKIADGAVTSEKISSVDLKSIEKTTTRSYASNLVTNQIIEKVIYKDESNNTVALVPVSPGYENLWDTTNVIELSSLLNVKDLIIEPNIQKGIRSCLLDKDLNYISESYALTFPTSEEISKYPTAKFIQISLRNELEEIYVGPKIKTFEEVTLKNMRVTKENFRNSIISPLDMFKMQRYLNSEITPDIYTTAERVISSSGKLVNDTLTDLESITQEIIEDKNLILKTGEFTGFFTQQSTFTGFFTPFTKNNFISSPKYVSYYINVGNEKGVPIRTMIIDSVTKNVVFQKYQTLAETGIVICELADFSDIPEQFYLGYQILTPGIIGMPATTKNTDNFNLNGFDCLYLTTTTDDLKFVPVHPEGSFKKDYINSIKFYLDCPKVTIPKNSFLKKDNKSIYSTGTAGNSITQISTFTGWVTPFNKTLIPKFNSVELGISIGDATDIGAKLVILDLNTRNELLYKEFVVPNTGIIQVEIPEHWYSLLPEKFYLGFRITTPGIIAMPFNCNPVSFTLEEHCYYTTKDSQGWTKVHTADTPSYSYINYINFGNLTKTLSYYDDSELQSRLKKLEEGDGIKGYKYLNLPANLYAVNGDKLEIFNKGIITIPNNEVLSLEVNCSKGNVHSRKWYYDCNSADGNFNARFTLRTQEGALIEEKYVSINTSPKKNSPSQVKNILCVGDSLTSGGDWCRELDRRLTESGGLPTGDNLSNIKFIGSKKNGKTGYEGYGGWTYVSYSGAGITDKSIVWINVISGMKTSVDQHAVFLANNGTKWKIETIDNQNSKLKMIRTEGSGEIPINGNLTWVSGGIDTSNIEYILDTYEGGNPFYIGGKVDFKAYAAKLNVQTIDICYIFLGWNQTYGTKEQFKDSAKQFINLLRRDYPNVKIGLLTLQVPSKDGFGVSYGSSWYYGEKLRVVNDFKEAYEELITEYSNITLVHTTSQFDADYCYPTITRAVNNRVQINETVQSNGVHPNVDGQYMIADAVYREFVNNNL